MPAPSGSIAFPPEHAGNGIVLRAKHWITASPGATFRVRQAARNSPPFMRPEPPGEKPEAVRLLQRALWLIKNMPMDSPFRNVLSGVINGRYDLGTEADIKAFQGVVGLTRSGIAGPQTLKALDDELVARNL